MKLRIIAVTYNHSTELEVFLGSLLLQTSPDWTCEIWHDGPAPPIVHEIMSYYADERIKFICTLQRNGIYGHPNRGSALKQLVGDDDDLVLITNCDNVYIPGFVSQFLEAQKAKPNVGIVYCNTVHSHYDWALHESKLREGQIDMGAAAIRLDIAKSVGFRWTHYSADGRYIEECAKETIRRKMCAVHIAKPLFIHN